MAAPEQDSTLSVTDLDEKQKWIVVGGKAKQTPANSKHKLAVNDLLDSPGSTLVADLYEDSGLHESSGLGVTKEYELALNGFDAWLQKEFGTAVAVATKTGHGQVDKDVLCQTLRKSFQNSKLVRLNAKAPKELYKEIQKLTHELKAQEDLVSSWKHEYELKRNEVHSLRMAPTVEPKMLPVKPKGPPSPPKLQMRPERNEKYTAIVLAIALMFSVFGHGYTWYQTRCDAA